MPLREMLFYREKPALLLDHPGSKNKRPARLRTRLSSGHGNYYAPHYSQEMDVHSSKRHYQVVSSKRRIGNIEIEPSKFHHNQLEDVVRPDKLKEKPRTSLQKSRAPTLAFRSGATNIFESDDDEPARDEEAGASSAASLDAIRANIMTMGIFGSLLEANKGAMRSPSSMYTLVEPEQQEEDHADPAPPLRPHAVILNNVPSEPIKRDEENTVFDKQMIWYYDHMPQDQEDQAAVKPLRSTLFSHASAIAAGITTASTTSTITTTTTTTTMTTERTTTKAAVPYSPGTQRCPSECSCVCSAGDDGSNDIKTPTLLSSLEEASSHFPNDVDKAETAERVKLDLSLYPCARSAAYNLSIALRLCRID